MVPSIALRGMCSPSPLSSLCSFRRGRGFPCSPPAEKAGTQRVCICQAKKRGTSRPGESGAPLQFHAVPPRLQFQHTTQRGETAMGQQQSNQNAKRRRRSTALAAGFVTGSSGKVEEKYCIDVSPRTLTTCCCDQLTNRGIFPQTRKPLRAAVFCSTRARQSLDRLWSLFFSPTCRE